MKIRIVEDGREVPAVSHRTAPPLHLIELQMQAPKVLPGVNMGMRAIERMGRRQAAWWRDLQRWEKAAVEFEAGNGPDPGEEPEEPETTTLSVGVLAFLSLRAAGERVTLEQALTMPIQFVPEPGDEQAAAAEDDDADPSMPGSGDPATPDSSDAAAVSTGPSTT